jgi:hypothetical protein
MVAHVLRLEEMARPRWMLARAVVAQAAGMVLGAVALALLPPERPGRLGVALAVAAVGAAAVGRFALRQPPWWGPIHLVFLPAVVAASGAAVPSEVYPVGFLALLLVFWGTFRGDVPLYLSSSAVTEAVIALVAEAGARVASVADLGAGVGTVAVPLARRLPGVRVDAWERAPVPFLLTRARALMFARRNVSVHAADFWQAPLGGFDLVFAFLSPVVMERLAVKVRAEMRPGTLFVSAAFECPGWVPERTLVLADRRETRVYVYRV